MSGRNCTAPQPPLRNHSGCVPQGHRGVTGPGPLSVLRATLAVSRLSRALHSWEGHCWHKPKLESGLVGAGLEEGGGLPGRGK